MLSRKAGGTEVNVRPTDELIEEIDIGGPSLVRAAAKNFRGVFVVVDPGDYARLLDALDGGPGIQSARWAGPNKDFRGAMNRIQTLLIERGAKTPEERRAHFIAALCLAWPDGHVEEFEGRVDGVIVWPPRGFKGFGYDPLFKPDGFAITFGEMTAEEKHGLPPKGKGLSHRARAFIALAKACLSR